MKKVILIGMLLGLLTGVGVAQRGRAPGGVSATARPNADLGTGRSVGVSPTIAPNRTTTVNRNVDPTPAPIRDPKVGSSSTIAPNGTVTRNVDPTLAPVRDPLVGTSQTSSGSTTTNRNVDPTAAPPVRDPK